MSFVCDNSMRTHFFVYLTSESLNTATAYGERRRTNSTRGVRDATTKATTRWAIQAVSGQKRKACNEEGPKVL